MTEFEIKLWNTLRDRRFCSVKFRRQVQIGNYIVDFVCFEKRVIIELDGSGHLAAEQIKYDEIRSKYLKDRGYTILRFWNNEISNNYEEVLNVIYKAIN